MAQSEIPLYPDFKIESQPTIVERGDAQRPNRSIRGAFAPTLTAYLPAHNPTGTAVILWAGTYTLSASAGNSKEADNMFARNKA